MAACVPNEIQPDINAPLIAPQIAPVLLLHGTSIPNVNIPNVVPAAMADKDVATWNKLGNVNELLIRAELLELKSPLNVFAF